MIERILILLMVMGLPEPALRIGFLPMRLLSVCYILLSILFAVSFYGFTTEWLIYGFLQGLLAAAMSFSMRWLWMKHESRQNMRINTEVR